MNGIINVLKPAGMTSHDVVDFFRKTLNIEKAGHTGTLDPWAAGVLPICTGKATKLSEYVMRGRKRYRAGLALGVTTDTLDAHGRVTGRSEINVSEDRIIELIRSFEGVITQMPPMYSAIKVAGRKLCDAARSGETVERKPREVEIYSIGVINMKMPDGIIIDVECSKGTYIRTLCADIGEKAGCGAHMSFLIRTATGVFNIDKAYTLEQLIMLKSAGRLQDALLPMDITLGEYEKISLNANELRKFVDGVYIEKPWKGNNDIVRVYDEREVFTALGRITRKDGRPVLKIEKLLI